MMLLFLLFSLCKGPCPPCPKTVKTKCYCGKNGPLIRRCSKKTWSCGSVCGKMLECGHHKCSNPCHAGNYCFPYIHFNVLCFCASNRLSKCLSEFIISTLIFSSCLSPIYFITNVVIRNLPSMP